MIEMKVFADINKIHPIEIMTLECNAISPVAEGGSKKGWLKRLFHFKRQVWRKMNYGIIKHNTNWLSSPCTNH